MSLSSLAFTLFMLSSIESRWILFKYSSSISDDLLQTDCFHILRKDTSIAASFELCLRLTYRERFVMKQPFINNYEQSFTYEHLRESNITTEHLFLWFIPLEVIEKYQKYLNEPSRFASLSNHIIYKCKDLWIGEQCQYTLDLKFSRVMQQNSTYIYPVKYNMSCFDRLSCESNGESICLDWSEICDGKIDCTDHDEDEKDCYHIETNECDQDEYRCRNGLCVSKYILQYPIGAYCINDIGIHHVTSYESNYFDQSVFIKQYLTDWDLGFSELEHILFPRTDLRKNQRLISISKRTSMSYQCWSVMICLTKIQGYINGTTCHSFLKTINIHVHLMETCDSFVFFPENPILSSHIYLLYDTRNLSSWNRHGILIPAYVCVDKRACEHFNETFLYENRSCQSMDPLNDIKKWISIMDYIESKFKWCLNFPTNYTSEMHSSLYCCRNSTRCISKYRVLDDFRDCPFNDDETAFDFSCTIPNRQLYHCDNQILCRSPSPNKVNCINPLRQLEELRFYEICDRTVHIRPILINGKNHTDETDCENWNCSNPYTRCDQHWACPNGEDEYKCFGTGSRCPRGTHECLSIENLTIFCLPAHKVSDQIVDCIGGTDERDICKKTYHMQDSFNSFLCSKESKCLPADSICDNVMDCSTNDDEVFCHGLAKPIACYGHSFSYKKEILSHICKSLSSRRHLFTGVYLPNVSYLHSKSPSPMAVKRNGRSHRSLKRSYCLEGLEGYLQINDQQYRSVCFCPLQFYGVRCQYQREIISVRLQLQINEDFTMITLISYLVDDNDERQTIYSHHYASFTHDVGCEQDVEFNLVYPTRPKRGSANYSVRVDAFDRISMMYVSSWYYPIRFPFLPAYPLVIALTIPFYSIAKSTACPVSCVHGNCIRYNNVLQYFCRCDHGWSGVRCDIPLNQKFCAPGSLLTGFDGIRPICLCPLNVIGHRCTLKTKCKKDQCGNDAKCVIVSDESRHAISYCICKHTNYGYHCKSLKIQARISFDMVKFSNYVIVYFSLLGSSSMSYVPKFKTIPFKIRPQQTFIEFVTMEFPTVILIQNENDLYLIRIATVDSFYNITHSVIPSRRCSSFKELLSQNILNEPRIRRIKYYHQICHEYPATVCFYDELFICFCTQFGMADCINWNHNLTCNHELYCRNGAKCIQSQTDCSTKTICLCHDCFYGDRCQFYVGGIGLTVEDILGNHIRVNTLFSNQPTSVKVTLSLTLMMFIIGIINSILTLMTFSTAETRKVGAGLYLFASSISSFTTVSLLTIKLCFFYITHVNLSISTPVRHIGCKSIEFLLKVSLCTDTWLNASVAIERYINIRQESSFNATSSKRIAKFIIPILPIVIGLSFIYEPIHRNLFKNKDEDRFWCFIEYSTVVHTYSNFIQFFHILVPFFINVCSAILIIIKGADKRSTAKSQRGNKIHLINQIKVHKHLVMSPLILVLFSVPRLIVALLVGCSKTDQNPWLFISGYFISFLPSVIVFIIFVLPSTLYVKEFRKSLSHLRRLTHRGHNSTAFTIRR